MNIFKINSQGLIKSEIDEDVFNSIVSGKEDRVFSVQRFSEDHVFDLQRFEGDEGTNYTATTLQGLSDALTSTSYTNIYITSTITVSATTTLDLNGKTISGTIDKLLKVGNDGNLTISDSSGTGKITTSSGTAIYVDCGTLTVSSGTITGNNTGYSKTYI